MTSPHSFSAKNSSVGQFNTTRTKADRSLKPFFIAGLQESKAEESGGIWERQGGKICSILPGKYHLAHPWNNSHIRAPDPLASHCRHQDPETGWLEKRLFWGNTLHSRHPSTVFLATKLCNLGCAAALPRPRSQTGGKFYHYKILPASAGVYGDT